MAEPVYLNYGNDSRVAQEEFLVNAANLVNSYVQSQPWSKKKKEKFMEAYSNLMNIGISGASIRNGQWAVDLNGTFQIPELDLGIYLEAAYFILQLMSGLASKQDEKQALSDLKSFTNDEFVNGFESHLRKNIFGGLNWNIGGPEDNWNYRDKRGANGKRGIKERARILAELLESYGKTINENSFKFDENSPFSSYTDFKTRLDNAVSALRTELTEDDIPNLDSLGLNYKKYFNDGSGDTFTKGDYSGTYGDYYSRYLPELQKQLVLLKQKELATQPKYYASRLKYTGDILTTKELADKYGSTEGLINQIRQYSTKGLSDLSNNEKRELTSAFIAGAKEAVSDEEWNILKRVPSLKGSARSRFKKIKGVDNLILDSATNQVIHLYDENFRNGLLDDFLAGLSSLDLEKEYLNSVIPGLTSAETKELMAIGLDIASIVNPEPVTAGGFGAAAATLRHLAKEETPGHKWSFWEGVGQGLDYVTGILGAVPLGGDLVLFGKTLIKGSKVIPIIQKGLRYAMRYGSWKDIYDGALSQDGRQTVDKIISGEELNVLDWRHIGEVIRGIAGHHTLNKSNRVLYKTAEKLGLETEATSDLSRKMGSNELWRKTGFASSKVKTLEQSSKLKLSKTKEDGSVETKDISITPEKREQLEEAFRKVKPSERTAEAKRILGEEKIGDFEVVTEGGWRAKARNWNQYTRKTKDSFSTEMKDLPNRGILNTNELNKWLNNRNYLDRVLYGTNELIENVANSFSSIGSTNALSEVSTETPTGTPTGTPTETSNTATPRTRQVLDDFSATGKAPVVPKHRMTKSELKRADKKLYNGIDKKGRFTNNMPEEGVYEFKDPIGNTHRYELIYRDDDFLLDIKSSNGTHKLAVLTLDQVKLGIWNNIKQSLNTGIRHNVSLPANIIRALQGTAYRWLKQGGRIDRLRLQRYKNFYSKI